MPKHETGNSGARVGHFDQFRLIFNLPREGSTTAMVSLFHVRTRRGLSDAVLSFHEFVTVPGDLSPEETALRAYDAFLRRVMV